MATDSRNSALYKLVLLGNTAVGKSCLVVRFCRNEFSEFQEPTIGAAFLTQMVQLSDETVRFEIWDTAGQERYKSLAPMYYRGAAAAVVVYDITNDESFDGAKKWVVELQRKGDPNVVIALAGNKADLESDRKVDRDVAMEYAKSNGLIFMETSAKTDSNVQELFIEIAKKLPRAKPKIDDETVDFDQAPAKKGSKCCKQRVQQAPSGVASLQATSAGLSESF